MQMQDVEVFFVDESHFTNEPYMKPEKKLPMNCIYFLQDIG